MGLDEPPDPPGYGPAFKGEPLPLKDPIIESEVEHSMYRLNNNRAGVNDELPGELLKHGSKCYR